MYDDYYEDVFDEPSEVEKIILTAKEDIANLLSAEVKQTIEDAAGAKKRLEQLQHEIRNAEHRLFTLQKQVKEAEERADQAENYDVPARYIAKFVRNATSDLAPGDVVWTVEDDGKWEKCPVCNGREDVIATIGGRDIEVKCPECNGRGTKYKKRSKVVKKTVDSIHLKLCFSANRVCYWNRENIYLRGKDYSTDPKNIFKSEEEAQAAAAKEETK